MKSFLNKVSWSVTRNMAMGTANVLLRNGYADWKPASALAELRRTFGSSAKTIVEKYGLDTAVRRCTARLRRLETNS